MQTPKTKGKTSLPGNPLLLYLPMGKIAREKKNNTPEEIFRGQRLKKASQSLPPAGGK